MSSSENHVTPSTDGSTAAANNPSILISGDGCLTPAATGGKDLTAEENFHAGRRNSYTPVSSFELQPTLPDVRRRQSLAPIEGVQIHGAVLGEEGMLPVALGVNRSFVWGELSSCDSIGSFHSDIFEERGLPEISRTVTERVRQLVQRFIHRTERFKEKTVQPPTPSSSSIDAVSGVSGVSEPEGPPAGRQHRLDSFIPLASSASGGVDANELEKELIGCGPCRFKIPRFIRKLRPKQSIDSSSTSYLVWLFIVSLAFLYNGVAGPLRTAFKRAPIYKLNENLFPIAPSPPAGDPIEPDDNSTFNNISDSLNHADENDAENSYFENSFSGRRLLYALNSSDATQSPLEFTETPSSTDKDSAPSRWNTDLSTHSYSLNSQDSLTPLHNISFSTPSDSSYTTKNPYSTEDFSLTQTPKPPTSSQVTYPFSYHDNGSVFSVAFSKNPLPSAQNLLLYSPTSLSEFSPPDIFTQTGFESDNATESTEENVTTTSPDESDIIGYFPGYETDENRVYWWITDYICDLIYIVDIVFVKSRVIFLKNGIPETNSKEVRANYMSKSNFKFDLLSLLPLDIFYCIPAVDFNPMLRLPRLLKIQTFWEFYDRLDKRVSSAYFVRVARILCYMMYLIHLETCGLFAMSAHIGIGSDGWVYDGTGIAYVHCMYLATKTATSIGNNVQPNTQVEYMFMTIYWLAGVFIFAMLIGQIRDIFAAADANHDRYRTAIDQTTFYMKSLNVPKELQTRVKMWFTYNWEHSKTLDENSLLEALPKKMRADLAIHVHFNTLSKVNLFQDCDKNLLYDLVLKLKPFLYLPGDYICRKGEVGTEMYIVMMGHVEVVGGPNNSIVFATLKEGSVFGEISLLALEGGNRRTADVRSKGYSQLFLLSKADFEEAMSDYPEAQKILRKKAKKLLSQNAKHQAKTPSAEVEEIIRSRQGTPKLIKTVIKMVNEDSRIPDYLGVRRKSSNKPEGEESRRNSHRGGNISDRQNSLAVNVEEEKQKELEDTVLKYEEEYLIIEKTETVLGDEVLAQENSAHSATVQDEESDAKIVQIHEAEEAPSVARIGSLASELSSELLKSAESSQIPITKRQQESMDRVKDQNSVIRELLSSPPPGPPQRSVKPLRRTNDGRVFPSSEIPPAP